MNVQDKRSNKGRLPLLFFKGLLMVAFVGALSGLVGAAFSHSVSFVTALRAEHGWILWLLPLGGLLSVLIYKLFKIGNTGTDDAVQSAHTDKKVAIRLTPAVFICSVITHLFGGSAGREGAALKMGGGIAALATRLFGLDERSRRTVALAGMSGVFAAVFGTPVGAAIFTLEVVRSRTVRWWGIIASLFSSVIAYLISVSLFVKPERFAISRIPTPSFDILWRVAVVALLGGLVSFVFCHSMHLATLGAKKLLKNDYLRIAVMAALIVGLTYLVGTTDYNGGGINIIEGIFEGETVGYEAFALKIVFTALTVAAGFKGGEIVPAFFVGATFGAAAAPLLGISPAFGAMIGMTALFCGVTNCPIASVVIACEMFGAGALPYFAVTVILSFAVSGKASLYDTEKIPFKTFKEEKKAL